MSEPSFNIQKQIDPLADQFEAEFKAGKRPRIEIYLEQNQDLGEHLFKALLDLEFELRIDKPTADEYISRFPQFKLIIEELFSPELQPTIQQESHSDDRRWVGPYKILQPIGKGGMGQVYMAEQFSPVKRRVALKVIRSETPSKEILARFEAERQALAMMDHQNIAKVLDAGITDDGRPYFAMELVKGVPITEYCDRQKLSLEDRLKLFIQGCRAIQHAHQKGIIHRDIKPSNMLVTLYDGMPVTKVIDFGLAKALQDNSPLTEKTLFTRYGQVVGTLEYMSPEQAEMNTLDIDTRADVYSLGVVLYELLTGSTPIGRERLQREALDQILRLIREEDAPHPSTRLSDSGDAADGISQQRRTDSRRLRSILKGELDWIAIKALEKDRTRRYDGPAALADDVQRYLDNDAIEARPPSFSYKIQKAYRKNRVGFLTAGGILVLLVVGSLTLGQLLRRALLAESEVTVERDLARASTGEAQEASRLLKQEQLNLQLQLRLSNSMRLTTLAQSLEENAPLTSLLLHVEGAKAVRLSEDGIFPLLHQGLRDGIRRIEGIPLFAHHHHGGVSALCISADSKRVATGGEDGTVRVSSFARTKSAQSGRILGNHAGVVTTLVFIQDGALFSGGSDGSLVVWSSNGSQEAVVDAHSDAITSIAFCESRNLLITAGKDTMLRIWQLDGVRPILEGASNTGEIVTSLFISPSARWVYAATTDGLAVWDLDSKNFDGSREELGTMLKSVDGEKIISLCSNGLTVTLFDGRINKWEWDLNHPKVLEERFEWSKRTLGPGAELGLPDDFVAKLDGERLRVALKSFGLLSSDPNRDLLVSLIQADPGADDTPLAWLSKAVLRRTRDVRLVPDLDASTNLDGRYVFMFGTEKFPILYDCDTGDWHRFDDELALVTSAAFSKDGNGLVVGMLNGSALFIETQSVDDPVDELFRLPNPSITSSTHVLSGHLLSGHQESVELVAFSDDRKWIVTT